MRFTPVIAVSLPFLAACGGAPTPTPPTTPTSATQSQSGVCIATVSHDKPASLSKEIGTLHGDGPKDGPGPGHVTLKLASGKTWSGDVAKASEVMTAIEKNACEGAGGVIVAVGKETRTDKGVSIDGTLLQLTPDEKLDLDNMCHAMERMPKIPELDDSQRIRVAHEFIDEHLTTVKWMKWHRDAGKQIYEAQEHGGDPAAAKKKAAKELADAAKGAGIADCSFATTWGGIK